MSIPVFKALTLAATAMSVVQAVPSYAQDERAGAFNDGTIIVTARRMEENLQDVPISITVFSQEQLDNRNITNSTELAAYTPSLSVNSRYGPDKASFSIRGFSQELATLPTVGVYFADVVAPTLRSNITSGNGAGPGNMFDLQNIQVLKGPQGTLFGKNTTGGAILLVPRKPTGNLEGYIEGTYGNYDQKRVQAVLNLPLADTFKVRAGVDWNKRDGYVNNRSGIGPKDFLNVDYFAARFSMLAEVTPSLENYTVASYSKSTPNGVLGKVAYCNRGNFPAGLSALSRAAVCAQKDFEDTNNFGYYDAQNSNPDAGVRQRIWQIINTTTWEASDALTIKNIASYGEAREAYSFNIIGDVAQYPFVTTHPGVVGPQGNQSTFTEELQLQGSTADDRLTWQVGGYLERSSPIGTQEQYTAIFSDCADVSEVYSFTCNPLFLGPFPVGSISVARNNFHYRNEGLYAQATYHLAEKFSVTGGIRYTWDWQRSDSNAITVRPSPIGQATFDCTRAPDPPILDATLLLGNQCERTFIQKSSKPTWLINLDYTPIDDLLVYAKYARGYRGGGINEQNLNTETWGPEKVDNYEIGLKASFQGAVRGRFNIAGFWNEFSDQQTTVTIPQCVIGVNGCTQATRALTGINGIQNLASSRLRGVEVDGSLTFFDSLTFDFGYAYLDAKVTDGGAPGCDPTVFDCAAATFLATGSTLPYSPKNRVTVTGTYTLPLDESLGRISLGATFTHTDATFTVDAAAAGFAAGVFPFDAGINPATDLLNLNVNWNSVAGSPIDLALFATNVTKEKYYVNGGSLTSVGGDFLIVGPPRFYGVRVKFNFGQ